MTEDPHIETADVQAALAASGILVTFSRRSWSGKMLDVEAAKLAAQAAGAKGRIGDFRKNLLAGNDQKLIAVSQAINAAYNAHVDMTLPWGNSEFRLLPNACFMDYAKVFNHHKEVVTEKLRAFIDDYPDAVQRSLPALGSLAKMVEYPSIKDIISRFAIEVHFEPIPVGATFPGMPPELGAILQKRLNDKIIERAKGAIEEMFKQAREAVARLHNQTRPEGRIHDNSVLDVIELPARIRAFNLVRDPRLEALAAVIQQELGFFDTASIKKDTIRAAVHGAAQKVLEQMP